jgi:hypothetical protein
MIPILFKIITLSSATILILFLLGFGLAQLFLPSSLKKHSFWLTPWLGFFYLIFTLVISSLAGFTVIRSSPVIILVAVVFDTITLLQKKIKMHFEWKNEFIIALFIGISIIFNTSPLIRRERFLTSLSLGNNDIIAYVTSADYLLNNSIISVFNTPVTETVSNLLGGFYRFGPPIILSFFINLLRLDAYQFFYLFQSVLFALTLPLLYIFLKIIYEKTNIFSLIFLFVTFIFNVNLLYILYHDFFGQTIFWSIQMFLLIFLFSYLYENNENEIKLAKFDYILGIAVAVFYYTYHEPAAFMFAPLMLFTVISFLKRKNIGVYLIKFVKIGLIAFICGWFSIVYSMAFDFKLAFNSNPNQPIGWELFRSKIPFANPFEAMGFYSIHSFPPLANIIAIILSILTIGVVIYGVTKSSKKLLVSSYLIVFAFFCYWLGIYHPNFFVYNRALTYVLPVWLVVFTVGMTGLLHRFNKSIILKVIICLLIGGEIFSAIKLNKKFIGGLSVDRSLVSLRDLKKISITEPVYVESFINESVPLWKQNWLGYFIYTKNISIVPTLFNLNKYENRVPDNGLLLLSKTTPWVRPSYIILKDVIWSNNYFQLGHVCNSDDCLLQSPKNLSAISIGKNDYEDSLLISGWEKIDGESRWANAKESTLRLIVKNSNFSKIVIEAMAFKESEELTVYIDDILIGKIKIKESWESYSLPVNFPLNAGVHKIKFVYFHGYRPMDVIPGNLDTRTLYVNFKEIKLE